jgi:hypothetical protein
MQSYQRKSLPKSISRKKRSSKGLPNESALQKSSPSITSITNPKTAEEVIALQRLIGNAATRQLLQPAQTRVQPIPIQRTGMIQRLPSSAAIQGVAGTAKKDKKIGSKVIKSEGTRYKALLASFDAYHSFLNSYASIASLPTLKGHFMTLKTDVQGYIGSKGSGFKYAYFKSLLTQIDQERDFALKRFEDYQASGLRRMVRWQQLVGVGPSTVIKDSDITGSDKGGSHSVEKTTMNGGAAFYKGNIDVVPNEDVMNAKGFENKNIYKGTALEGMDNTALMNAYNVPNYAGMFDPAAVPSAPSSAAANKLIAEGGAVVDVNLRLANRDVATSRINDLLNAGVIAHAELAFRKRGKNLELGSLMAAAKGKQGSKATFAAQPGGKDVIGWNDPKLQQSLSRLQLMDALTGQVDRNMSNFFIQTDDAGNVTGLTGIDNDMAFGKRRDNIDFQFNFPGISAFVDADLARSIIALKPQDLIWLLDDLLDADELAALVTRLKKLQAFLTDLQNKKKLLKPDQWDAATAQGMLDEDSSYYAKLHKLHN